LRYEISKKFASKITFVFCKIFIFFAKFCNCRSLYSTDLFQYNYWRIFRIYTMNLYYLHKPLQYPPSYEGVILVTNHFLGRPPFSGTAADGGARPKCGFKRSTEMASKRSPSCTIKYFVDWCITLYGPRYAGLSAGAGGGNLMYTNSASNKLSGVASGESVSGGGRVSTHGTAACSCCPKNSAGDSAAVTNEPGKLRGAPYTNSAVETPESSRGAALIPNSTQGRCAGQLRPLHHAVALGVESS
jgi:hypothetical protein